METSLILPKGYETSLNIRETEIAIKTLKDFFERELAKSLNLTRVSAPLLVEKKSGLNDNLNGVERPVAFDIKGIENCNVEIVHSLAKWKRLALHKYSFKVNEGLYTDMNAIRRDEDLDNTHSIYVDQWDWEKILTKEDRNIETLKNIVKSIYEVFKNTEKYICSKYESIKEILPQEIFFITAKELKEMYPDLSAKEREDAICRKEKAVFLIGIGGEVAPGEKHDGRAPDYDDWSLNGDILFYNPIFDLAFEVSSMGIRVDEDSMINQLKISNCEDRKELDFHKKIINKELPYTVGGGIGQSRICMFFLRKAHIGEVQSSIWPEDMIKVCEENKIMLL